MTYMFDNTLELEEERLKLCNILHNPKTLSFLKPHIDKLPDHAKILEVGCGTGLLAKDLYPSLPKQSQLYLLDRSDEQLDRCEKLFVGFNKVRFLKLDLITQAKELQQQGPFDLIYCRWVICHVPHHERIHVLKTLISALASKGVLLIEDCDNTSVAYKTHDNSPLPDYAIKAEQRFHETSKQICDYAHIHLQLSGEKILQYLQEASGHSGRVYYKGFYQMILNSKEEKRLLSLCWKTAFALVVKAKGLKAVTADDAHAFVAPAEQCDDNTNIYGIFLKESICIFEKK
jgi:SAM-dependent methyltransferase